MSACSAVVAKERLHSEAGIDRATAAEFDSRSNASARTPRAAPAAAAAQFGNSMKTVKARRGLKNLALALAVSRARLQASTAISSAVWTVKAMRLSKASVAVLMVWTPPGGIDAKVEVSKTT